MPPSKTGFFNAEYFEIAAPPKDAVEHSRLQGEIWTNENCTTAARAIAYLLPDGVDCISTGEKAALLQQAFDGCAACTPQPDCSGRKGGDGTATGIGNDHPSSTRLFWRVKPPFAALLFFDSQYTSALLQHSRLVQNRQ